ncbi:MAG: leucyl aminopeptidase [Anaerolineae bacterium]|nr:leucyl aminopeptidase [Anaerolineae bacterium]
MVLYTQGRLPAKRIILVGLGKPDAFSLNGIRQAAATAATKARELGLSELSVLVFGHEREEIGIERAAEAIAEGAALGSYAFRELKTEDNDIRPAIERLVVVVPDAPALVHLDTCLRAGSIIAESTALARDLVNRPANIATPSHIATAAQEIAAGTGLACRILDKTTMASMGMHLLLSVNQGGNEPAQLVILEHNADRADLPCVALVGKGITFDTGGISLKPSQGMEAMKGDMGGAAAVIGAMRAVALLDLPLRVVALAPLTENMPDAQATRPGDVVRSLKGLTVEVISTDAEGRMILADALTYAGEFKPDAIFDIATLTGSRIVALGDHAAAVMGDEGLIRRLTAAGEATAERVWPLPLFEAYGEQLKSDVADLKNVGGHAAGSITGGFFLSRFVPDDTPWVHIDIAGLALIDKATPYVPKGGTGFGVRLFVEMLRHWGDQE